MTQKEVILEHLKSGKGLTQLEATKKYGILRLASAIHVLRREEGYDIRTREHVAEKSGNVYVEYYLGEGVENADEPSLFPEKPLSPDERLKKYDTVDTSETVLQKGSPPEIGGTEIRAHHVSNPDDPKQILASFREYCEKTHGKKVEITSDWSRQLLKLNRDLPEDSTDDLIRNRNIRSKKLSDFKRALREGTFLYTNIGIGFDEDGWLCDGQTRLTASVQTGLSFFADVSFDISRDAFAVIDSPASARTNKDYAYMAGVSEYTSYTVAAISMLYRHMHGFGHTQKLTGKQLVDATKIFHDVGPSIRLAQRMRVVRAPKGIIAAVHYLASKVNKDVADKAFDDLITGAIADPRDPVLVARNRLISAYNSPSNEFRGAGDRKVRVLLSRAFNYRCIGLKIKSYHLNEGDDWPGDKVKPW